MTDKLVINAGTEIIAPKDDKESVQTVLMPIYVLDCMHQIYDKYISDIKCKHELKKHKKGWFNEYATFISVCMNSLDAETRDEIINTKLDAFGEYIHNDIMFVIVAISNYLASEYGDISHENKLILSACLTSSILIQIAQVYFRWLKCGNVADTLSSMRHHTERFMNLYFPTTKDIDCNKCNNIVSTVEHLCKKTVKYITQ